MPHKAVSRLRLLVLAWLQQGLLSGEVFFKRDTMLVFLPLKHLLSQAFAQRELPEWWPYDALGEPLASLPIASLYVALPESLAATLQTLVVLPLMEWRLARTLRPSRRVFEPHRSRRDSVCLARLETLQGTTPPSGNLASDLEFGCRCPERASARTLRLMST